MEVSKHRNVNISIGEIHKLHLKSKSMEKIMKIIMSQKLMLSLFLVKI